MRPRQERVHVVLVDAVAVVGHRAHDHHLAQRRVGQAHRQGRRQARMAEQGLLDLDR